VNVLIFSGRCKPRITETADTESADTRVLLYIIFIKFSIITLHERLFSCFQVITSVQTDGLLLIGALQVCQRRCTRFKKKHATCLTKRQLIRTLHALANTQHTLSNFSDGYKLIHTKCTVVSCFLFSPLHVSTSTR
jgi:hypothetical protein